MSTPNIDDPINQNMTPTEPDMDFDFSERVEPENRTVVRMVCWVDRQNTNRKCSSEWFPILISEFSHIPNDHPFFSDYKINLVQILDSGRYQFYNEDVRCVFDITQKIYTKNLQ